MTQIIANVLIRGGAGTRFWFILIALVAGAIIFEGICEPTLRTWIKRTRGRNWPAVSAVVDIVSVASCEDDSLLPTKAGLSFSLLPRDADLHL